MAPEDTDPAPGGPWPPRGARDPGHHATVTTDPQQDTLPHAHDNIPPCPARLDPRGLSSSPGAEAPSPGDDPSQEPLEAREGTTPNSDEAGFSPEGADRGHRAPSAVQASQGQDGGGGGQRRQGEGAQRATADQRVRSGSGGKGAPTKARAGPPGKRARDPTATSTRAVPRRPGTPASLSTLGAPPPPREPGPTPLGPTPTGPPPQGPVLNLRPSA